MSLRPRLYPDNLKTIFTAFGKGDMVLIITAGVSDTTHPVHFYIDDLALREGWRYTTDCSTGNLYAGGGEDGYRFGFNGMEMENDVCGYGNSYTTEFRQNDPRLGGRWWSIDPILKPWESPYAGYSNNPILYADPHGLDPCTTCAEEAAELEKKTKEGKVEEGTVWEDSKGNMQVFTDLGWEIVLPENEETKTETKSPNDVASDVITSIEILTASLAPSFESARRAGKLHPNNKVPVWIKKNIFKPANTPNDNAIKLGNIKGGTVVKTANVLKDVGPLATAASVTTTTIDIVKDGEISAGEMFVAINTGLMLYVPAYVFAYSVVDLSFSLTTGRSLTNKIQSGIDGRVNFSIDINPNEDH